MKVFNKCDLKTTVNAEKIQTKNLKNIEPLINKKYIYSLESQF